MEVSKIGRFLRQAFITTRTLPFFSAENVALHLSLEARARDEWRQSGAALGAVQVAGTDLGIPPTTGRERHSTRAPTPIPPTAPALFDPHHHRIRTDQVFHTGFPEPDVVQPATAVSPRIVETALRREQHVQTHQ